MPTSPGKVDQVEKTSGATDTGSHLRVVESTAMKNKRKASKDINPNNKGPKIEAPVGTQVVIDPDNDSLSQVDESEVAIIDPLDDKVEKPTDLTKGDEWIEVKSRQVRDRQKAIKTAERHVARNKRGLISSFEVDFKPMIEGQKFEAVNLFKIFMDIRAHAPDAQPRINKKGGITVRIPSKDQINLLRKITSIAGISVKLDLIDESSLWGRVSGVNPLFSESDLLTALKEQGVVEVVREKFATNDASCSDSNKRLLKPSNRIRIRFESAIKPSVTIAYELFNVTLCPPSPLQCLNCYGFGHRAAVCPKPSKAICRKCGKTGHQMWQCTSKAFCINCKGSHAANDRHCPVHAVYTKAAQERFMGKLTANLEHTEIKETIVGVTEAVAPAHPVSGEKASFAAVVGRPAMLTLVRNTKEGEKVICYVPKPPVVPKITAKAVIKNTSAKVSSKAEVVTPSPVNLDIEALTISISNRVLASVTAQLDTLVSKIVLTAIQNAIPTITQAVVAALTTGASASPLAQFASSAGSPPQVDPTNKNKL